MKIVNGFSLRNIAGSNIVVPVGTANVSFKGMITLNDSGVFLWKHLEIDRTEEDLLQAFLEEYDVDMETAKADIDSFIETLQRAALLA